MLLEDNEYKKALHFYLENLFLKNTLPENSEEIDLNVVKPLISYVKYLSTEKDDFLFSKPVYGWWDLTSACNFRCIHCLYNGRDYFNQNDLSSSEAMSLASELINDLEISCMNLTGGEIFLREDTLDIIKLFKDNNVAVRLATNAALLDDEKISKLSNMFNPYTDMVQVSLDAACSDTLKKIRLTDLYEKIINNIRKLISAGITVNVAFTVNNINYKEVIEAYKICNELGVNTFFAGKLMIFNDNHKKIALSDKELLLLYENIHSNDFSGYKTEIKTAFFSILETLNLPFASEILKEERFIEYFKKFKKTAIRECNSHDRLSIRSDGRVYMCMQAETCPNALMGNYRENSLLEIWNKRFDNIFFEKRRQEDSVCKDCGYNVICNSGCKAFALERFNDINLPEKSCKFAKASL